MTTLVLRVLKILEKPDIVLFQLNQGKILSVFTFKALILLKFLYYDLRLDLLTLNSDFPIPLFLQL